MRILLVLIALLLCSTVAHAAPVGAKFNFLPRRNLDVSKIGVNAFANEPRFGTVKAQLREVSKTLQLNSIRILFAWNDQVQPSPSSVVNFSFYDDIARNIPRGTNALVVLTGLPSWMSSSENWIDGDPRRTFARRWVDKVAARYARNRRIIGFQIWNEPNDNANPHNGLLGMDSDPIRYVQLVSEVRSQFQTFAPGKLLVSAATTAINQNYPDTLDYNRTLQDEGLESLVDVWGCHFYGTHYENVLRPDGVADFLNELSTPVWLTEIGEKGINKQRAYMERTLPFLLQFIPSIKRSYIYQFTESTPANSTYGLRNLTPGLTVSDLYIWLRDRKKNSIKK